MASEAQTNANRENAQHSTGPRTDEGRMIASANAKKLGLFTTNNCIFPGEEDEYASFRDSLWTELAPRSPLQEVHAAEIVRAAWRLRRCAMAEERLGWRVEWKQEDQNRRNRTELPPSDPSICDQTMKQQASVDRARAQAQHSLKRAQAALEKLQNEANRVPGAAQPADHGVVNANRAQHTINPTVVPDQKDTSLQNEPNSDRIEVAVSASVSPELQNEPNRHDVESDRETPCSPQLQNEPNSVLARAA